MQYDVNRALAVCLIHWLEFGRTPTPGTFSGTSNGNSHYNHWQKVCKSSTSITNGTFKVILQSFNDKRQCSCKCKIVYNKALMTKLGTLSRCLVGNRSLLVLGCFSRPFAQTSRLKSKLSHGIYVLCHPTKKRSNCKFVT